MQSARPKVLHTLAGQTLLARVVHTAQSLQPAAIHVVIGHAAEEIRSTCAALSVHWVLQTPQLGTGHAVLQALPAIPDGQDVLILSADVPLITTELLQALIQDPATLRLLLADTANPHGLGRIVRDTHGQIQAIVEEKDACAAQKQIHEVYTGICGANSTDLKRWTQQLTPENKQQEYYLTDILKLAVQEQCRVSGILANDISLVSGVNTRSQLVALERTWQERYAQSLLAQGVSLADPKRIDVRGELHAGHDVFIDINALFVGVVNIGEGCIIEANCCLTNVTLHPHCHI